MRFPIFWAMRRPASSCATRRGRRRSQEREPKPIPHGTANGYKKYKCRCFECRAASAAEARQVRLNKKIKEFGPDAVKTAAAGLGLKPSEALTRVLEENAKAEKAARKADK
jgi:hypothetical protein